SRRLCRGHVLGNDVNGLLIFLLWTELETLGVLLKDRHMSRFEVIDVSGLQDIVTILALDAHAAPYEIAPMWRLAHVARQSHEQRCRIDTLGERFIGDDHPAPFGQAAAETISIVFDYWQLLHRLFHFGSPRVFRKF